MLPPQLILIGGIASPLRRFTTLQVVIIGRGYIGTEVAAALAGRGIAATMVLMGTYVVDTLFTPKIAAFYEKMFEGACAGRCQLPVQGQYMRLLHSEDPLSGTSVQPVTAWTGRSTGSSFPSPAC